MIYEIHCKYCGRKLFETREILISIMGMTTQCPNGKCGKILELPQDGITTSRTDEKFRKKLIYEERHNITNIF